MEKKSVKPKVKLTIAIPQSDKKIDVEPIEEQEIYVKPIYSMKNARKAMIKFNFDQEKLETVRQRKSKKLQRQKDILLKSLDVLKVGAISAIAEKQEQIDNLKSQIGCQEVRQLEEEVEELHKERKQLKQEIQQLEQKLQFQRESYMRLLEEKDRVIEQLYVELGSTQIQIEKLQKFEEMKEKKIKIIEQQNTYLFHQLQEEKIAHLKQVYQINQENMDFSSTPHIEPFQEASEKETPLNDLKNSQKENMNLSLIESRHKEEMSELTHFYEKRLSEMRQIYEKELQLWPFEHSKENSLNNQLMEDVASLKQTIAPVANKLSSELNAKKLSDCYSMTKRDFSKFDKSSVQGSERDPMDFNFKFMKRVANTPASQTTSSLKVDDGLRFMVAEAKKHQETEMSDDHKSQKQISNKDWKNKESVTSFMLGALTGGAVTFIINSIFRK